MSPTMMKVLITGANGQLGQEIVRLPVRPDIEIKGYGRDELDITDLAQCRSVIGSYRPHVVIHCAANTAVDLLESEQDLGYRVNAYGTRNVTVASEEVGAKLCYLSTDYVFDGRGHKPYREYDRTDPQSVYGRSKLAGEVLTQTLSSRYFIVRASWIYGKYGNNFVKTMLKLGQERKHLKVVHDQVGSPTYTLDLANFLLELVQTDHYGVYHASNLGECSWFEFARAIFEEKEIAVELEPCTTAEFPRPAPRPAYSVLDHGAIRIHGLQPLRSWREALRHYLQNSE